jgi:hypothetical protein
MQIERLCCHLGCQLLTLPAAPPGAAARGPHFTLNPMLSLFSSRFFEKVSKRPCSMSRSTGRSVGFPLPPASLPALCLCVAPGGTSLLAKARRAAGKGPRMFAPSKASTQDTLCSRRLCWSQGSRPRVAAAAGGRAAAAAWHHRHPPFRRAALHGESRAKLAFSGPHMACRHRHGCANSTQGVWCCHRKRLPHKNPAVLPLPGRGACHRRQRRRCSSNGDSTSACTPARISDIAAAADSAVWLSGGQQLRRGSAATMHPEALLHAQ